MSRNVFVFDSAAVSVGGAALTVRTLVPGAVMHSVPRRILDPECDALTSVEFRAEQCIHWIRGIQSSGPFSFIGCCGAARVAYEAAHQLLGNDEIVDLLALIDPAEPNYCDAVGLYCDPPLPIDVQLMVTSPTAAVELKSQWRALQGDRLNVHALYHAASTRVDMRSGSDSRSTLESKSRHAPYSSIVSIQTGKVGAPSVFCVPGAGATVTCFLPLAEALGNEFVVYGVQPRGHDGISVPHATVAAAAIAYKREILQVVPRGPYRLLGHSFGGWIVCELARQLVAAGYPVHNVMLIDSSPPSSSNAPRRPCDTQAEILGQLVNVLELSSGKSLEITCEDLRSCNRVQQLVLLRERMIAIGQLSRKCTLETVRGMVAVFAANVRADCSPCSPLPFAGHLLLAQEHVSVRDEYDIDARTCAALWRDFVPDLIVSQVPGNHMTLLAAPNVQTVADYLRRDWLHGDVVNDADARHTVERSNHEHDSSRKGSDAESAGFRHSVLQAQSTGGPDR